MHTDTQTKTDTLLWDRMERYPGEWNVDRRGDRSKTVHRREGKSTEGERGRSRRRRGREVRSSSLIVFQTPPLRPGVSQPNKPLH